MKIEKFTTNYKMITQHVDTCNTIVRFKNIKETVTLDYECENEKKLQKIKINVELSFDKSWSDGVLKFDVVVIDSIPELDEINLNTAKKCIHDFYSKQI